jgi:hypothetical protein
MCADALLISHKAKKGTPLFAISWLPFHPRLHRALPVVEHLNSFFAEVALQRTDPVAWLVSAMSPDRHAHTLSPIDSAEIDKLPASAVPQKSPGAMAGAQWSRRTCGPQRADHN